MSLWSNHDRSRSAGLRLLLGVISLLAHTVVRADTSVAGTIVDTVSGNHVVAARVTVLKGGEVIGVTTSIDDGSFRAFVNVPVQPEAQNLKLQVQRDGYAVFTRDVTVVSGRTDSDSYHLTLRRQEIVDCRQQRMHGVVVGYFRPPPAVGAGWDLAGAIRDTLEYDLVTRFQQSSLRPEDQPFIWTCPGANPQVANEHLGWAKALNADAFLAGHVAPAGDLYKVVMLVANRFSATTSPTRTTSKDVDLADPQMAKMDSSVHAAILAGILAGYQQSGMYAECVEVSVAAERILGSLPPDLAKIRQACLDQLPNLGLLPGGSP